MAHHGAVTLLDTDGGRRSDPERLDTRDAANERRSRAELRALLLAAAREILEDEGIQTASTNLTFKRVFERVERQTGRTVTNASVIRRVWDNMAEFQADVLVSVAQDERRAELNRTLEAVGRVLDHSDRSTEATRRQALGELCRIGGEASTAVAQDSVLWSAWIGVLAIATTAPDPDLRQRMVGALLDSYDTVARFWEGTLSELFGYLGFRIRAPRTIRQFVDGVLAWSEGNAIRQHVSGQVARLSLPTGRDRGTQEWTLFGIGLEGLVLQFFESDPDFVPPAT